MKIHFIDNFNVYIENFDCEGPLIYQKVWHNFKVLCRFSVNLTVPTVFVGFSPYSSACTKLICHV